MLLRVAPRNRSPGRGSHFDSFLTFAERNRASNAREHKVYHGTTQSDQPGCRLEAGQLPDGADCAQMESSRPHRVELTSSCNFGHQNQRVRGDNSDLFD